MAFIPSNKVYIYPTANRGENNPESRLNTEYNITNSVAKLLSFNDGSFVVKWDNTGHIICIHGYFIEITELPSGLTNPIWAHLYYKGEGTSGNYYHQEELAPNSGDNSSIDNDGDFIALELNNSESVSNENNNCWSLQITDNNGNVLNTSKFKFSASEIATDNSGTTSINNTFNTVNLNATNLKANGKEINITGSGDGVTIDTGIYSSDNTAGAEYIVSGSNYFEVVTRDTDQEIVGDKTFSCDITATGNVLFTNLGATGISGTTTKSLAINTQNNVKSTDLTTPSPTKNGTSLEFIDTISQNSYGKISATKKEITIAAGSNQGAIKINGSDYYINGIGTNNSPSFIAITTNTINPNESGATLNLGAYAKVYNNSVYGKGCLVAASNASSVGSNINPVYVNSNGNIVASTSNVGSTTQPIYLSGGTLAIGDQYAGGTRVTRDDSYKSTLNINSHVSGTTNTIYAPTTSGTTGQVLISGGSLGTPTWALLQLFEHTVHITTSNLDCYFCFYDNSQSNITTSNIRERLSNIGTRLATGRYTYGGNNYVTRIYSTLSAVKIAYGAGTSELTLDLSNSTIYDAVRTINIRV